MNVEPFVKGNQKALHYGLSFFFFLHFHASIFLIIYLIAKVSSFCVTFLCSITCLTRTHEEFPTWMAFYWIYTESDSIIGFEIFKIQ